eukprot:gnl/Spiro4/13979_TR7488_c0_g1_i1.p1 gnl/Spiro4/13979_TR7488_c0_g1~~gnl/Spiro4/13979_TR7488_c0_g1_i1.p1  ORF type:complete len:430 (+),score=11.69 gnl/Spiro4/13979_TR7488_c0_g1_i1:55-1344(+)
MLSVARILPRPYHRRLTTPSLEPALERIAVAPSQSTTTEPPVEDSVVGPAQPAGPSLPFDVPRTKSKAPLPSLVGMTLDEMIDAFSAAEVDRAKMRASQVWKWIYTQGVESFEPMTSIHTTVRIKLAQHFCVSGCTEDRLEASSDGTRKYLLNFGGQKVETVFIPEASRGTVCVSSQVGCSLSCKFCHTGTQKLVRNLKAKEIVNQVWHVRKSLGDFGRSMLNRRDVTNIVFMGQGEPLLNYRQVSKAIRVINASDGLSLSTARMVLSTSGVVPLIPTVGTDFPGINLAISLHAVTDELRDVLVPINKQYPLAELFKVCREFPSLRRYHRITFEYVMLKGVNDSPADARELVRLLRDFPAYVNLIPFNPWPGTEYECSPEQVIVDFSNIITSGGVDVCVRWPRGRDIMAACGQLRTDSVRAPRLSEVLE